VAYDSSNCGLLIAMSPLSPLQQERAFKSDFNFSTLNDDIALLIALITDNISPTETDVQ